MEGVIFLDSHARLEFITGLGILGFVLLIFGLGWIVFGLGCCIGDEKTKFCILGIVCLAFCMVVLITGTYQTVHYEVVLNEDLDFEAFWERYEVLDCKGIFYTIKERIR